MSFVRKSFEQLFGAPLGERRMGTYFPLGVINPDGNAMVEGDNCYLLIENYS